MKMQNAEMEFVTFDAQDVIATSNTGGGPKTAKFTYGGDLLSTWDYQNMGFWKKSGFDPSSSISNISLKVDGESQIDDTTWVLTAGTSSCTITDDSSFRTYNIAGATEGDTADVTLTSLDGIVEWLNKNGAGKQ